MSPVKHQLLAPCATPTRRGEPLRAAEAGDDAEVDLGLAELRLVAGVDEVARERELAAAAEREAVDRGDRRLRSSASIASPTRAPSSANAARLVGVMLGHLGDVGAGDERLVAGAGQDHDAHARVAVDLAQRRSRAR